MSIYASTLGFDGEDHVLHGCAAYREDPKIPGVWEFSGAPCDCPARYTFAIRYEGSHVYPDPENRGAVLDLAVIPGHIAEGGGYDEEHEHFDVACHRPFLRVGFVDPYGGAYPNAKAPPSHGEVILDAKQVEQLRDELTGFLAGITGQQCPAKADQDRKWEAFKAALTPDMTPKGGT